MFPRLVRGDSPYPTNQRYNRSGLTTQKAGNALSIAGRIRDGSAGGVDQPGGEGIGDELSFRHRESLRKGIHDERAAHAAFDVLTGDQKVSGNLLERDLREATNTALGSSSMTDSHSTPTSGSVAGVEGIGPRRTLNVRERRRENGTVVTDVERIAEGHREHILVCEVDGNV